MKLHLPFGLRKSLLACLATLAMPVLTMTLGTATSAFSGAAVVSFIAAHQSMAASSHEGDLHFKGGTAENPYQYNADEDLTVTGFLSLDENVEENGNDALNTAYATITIHGEFIVAGGLQSTGIIAVLEETENGVVVKSGEGDNPLQNLSALTVTAAGSDDVFVIGGDSSDFNRGLILKNGADLHVKANTALSYLSYGEGTNITIDKDATLSFGVVSTTYRNESGKNLAGAVYYQKDDYIKGDLHLDGAGTLDVKQVLFDGGSAAGHKLVDLYLNDTVKIKFSQYSYGNTYGESKEWTKTKGSVFKGLYLGDSANVTIQFGTNKSAVTFEDRFELHDGDNKLLTFEALQAGGASEYGQVHFQKGAEIDTLRIKGHTIRLSMGDDIHIKRFNTDDYNADFLTLTGYLSEDGKRPCFYIHAEEENGEGWTANLSIEAEYGDTLGVQVIKDGADQVTFNGVRGSSMDGLWVQEGGLFFTESDHFVVNGFGDWDWNLNNFHSDVVVNEGAVLGLGTRYATFAYDLVIEGDLDLSNGVIVEVNSWSVEQGGIKMPGNVVLGGLTTMFATSDDVTGTGLFQSGANVFDLNNSNNYTIKVKKDVVKKAYGIDFNVNNLTKLGEGRQILSNYNRLGNVTLGTADNPIGGVLELRDARGRIMGETKGADANATLLIHRYEATGSQAKTTSIAFAGKIDMAGSVGLHQGVNAYLGANDNRIGGLVGDTDEAGQGIGSADIVNYIRLAQDSDFDKIDIYKYTIKTNEETKEQIIEYGNKWWDAPTAANLTIDVQGEGTRRTHGGMLQFEDSITLVKDGAGMQEVTGILANTLIVNEGRFRITGLNEEHNGQRWLGKRVINNIIVDGAKNWAEEGEKSYFEVSVQNANYWTIADSTMTLRNGGIFRAAGRGVDAESESSSTTVMSEFYVGKLFVSRTVENAPAGAADGVIKWNTLDDTFSGDDQTSRDNNSHKFVFGLLSSVDENGVVYSGKDHVLEIAAMERASKNAAQGIVFRTIKDFSGTIKANAGATNNGNYFQIGMDVADVGFTTRDGRTGLDTSVIDTVNTGAYAEAEGGARENVFNTILDVRGSGVYSEVFRKRGDGKLTIAGENGLTIGSNGSVGGGVIFMNYAGDIEISSTKGSNAITVGNDVTLLYTTGENNERREDSDGVEQKGGVIDYLTVGQLKSLNNVYIDLLHLENVEDLLRTDLGISLGIKKNGASEEDIQSLKEIFTLRGIDMGVGKTTYELKLGTAAGEEDTVYLRVTSDQIYFTENDFFWDKAWGGVAYFAPTRSEMKEQEFFAGAEKADGFSFEANQAVDFVDNTLVLADSKYRGQTAENVESQDRMSIRLIGGGAAGTEDTTATVIGGRLYEAGDSTELTNTGYWEVRGNSYISLIDTRLYKGEEYVGEGDAEHLHFHLLVGGSSCVANVGDNSTMGDKTVEAVGGFKGNSHIQMDGGQVDYIVGGNHVNNSAFIFRGRSFISVMSGEVYGGIVGGSTLTKGSVNKYTQAFDGSTHIFVYTPLTNKENGDTPEISDGTKSADGVANAQFTAIVGGNAWIDLPATVVSGEDISLRPTFRGNSNIVIDLSGVQDEDVRFEKDIVGGNYTVYHGDNLLDEAGRRGTEYISNGLTSYVMVTANAEHAFTGDINGASRRASAGKGETYYTGNVQVRLRGGKYQKTVVGGLWLDASATGDHQARLIGNTEVNAGVNGAETATYWRLIGGSYSLAGGDEATEEYEGNSTVYLWGGTVSEEGALTGVNDKTDLGQLQLRVPMIVGGNLYRNNSGSELMRKGDTYVNIYGGKLDGVHVVGGDQANSSTDSSSSGNTSAKINGTSHIYVTTVDGGGNAYEDALTGQAASSVSITGLLVGGSYMTDAGTNGSVSVNNTEILLRGSDAAEVKISYENDPLHTHSGTQIAIVGGNMLVAQQTTGGDHTLTVERSTTIDVHNDVSITGNVVGGSYTNGTENGVNTIGKLDISDPKNPKAVSDQTVRIGIHGGRIDGNVYGGHYSSNATNSPDRLAIGDITITMDAASSQSGGYVKGNIVGGGYRRTTNDLTGSSTQGAIKINLNAGTLEGNVYAAGFNDGIYNASTGHEVHTETTSTHVSVESGFTFVKGVADAGLNDGDLLISGGYGRVDEKVARGSIDTFAKLTFWGSNESINNWANTNAGAVTLRNVNVVEVWGAGEKIEVDGDLYVLRKNENQEENFITKNGEGMLSVSRINTWASNDAAQSNVGYRGQIIVNDGYIKLTGASLPPAEPALLANEPMVVADVPEYRQDLSGGLTVNLATALQRHYNSKDNAYLQAHELKATGLGELYVNQEYGRSKISFTFGADSATYSTLKNERTLENPTLTKLHYGKYYLATGLADEITRANKDDYFDCADALQDLQDRISEWAKTNSQYAYYVADIQIIDHSLVLRVRDDREKFGWWWGCTGDSIDAHMEGYDTDRDLEILHDDTLDDGITWRDVSSTNWTQHGTQDKRYAAAVGDPFTNGTDDAWNLSPRGQNLHFGASGDGVTVELVNNPDTGDLAPRSVWVQDAQYTFVSSAESTGDAVLSIGSDTEANMDESDLMFDRVGNPNAAAMLLAAGELRVGGNYWETDAKQNPEDAAEAELVLGVQVSDMAVASLYNGGALVLDHEKSITKDTSIRFEGGLLGYTTNSADLGDLSARVSEESTGAVRIRVGETAIGTYHENDTPTKQDISITWGQTYDPALKQGVKLALETGFEKSGVDSFTLKWVNRNRESQGYVKVLEGELTYMSQSHLGVGVFTDRLTGEVLVKGGAKMTYLVTGNLKVMDVAGAITGAGHVLIGNGAGDNRTATTTVSPYLLSGDNSGFTGVLELLGASEVAVADLVGMNAATAAGGTGTTLRLAGRHLFFTEGAAKTIAVQSVQIVDDSVNYVGGFVDDDANKSITITGKLEWTGAAGESDGAKKSGILANAWGSVGEGFKHTYNGASLSGFTGVILAGAGATKTSPTTYAVGVTDSSDSTWTLKDDTDSTTEIQAHLGGAGSFVFDYNQDVRLTGYVGVDQGKSITDDDKKTSIANAQAGSRIVTIADGAKADWTDSVDPVTSITDLTKVTGHNIATGSISGGFVLGDANNYGTWSGTVLNGKAGELLLVNGVLKNALAKADGSAAELNVETLLTGSKVDVGGTKGQWFDNITINTHGQMLGAAGEITVDGGHTKVTLTLTESNVANTPGKPGEYLIVGGNDGVSMTVTSADDFTLNLSNAAFREMLKTAMDTTMSDAEKKTYLHIVGNGSLEIADDLHNGLLDNVKGANTALADMLGWSIESGAQTPGDIILIYTKPEDPDNPGGGDLPPTPPTPVDPTPLEWHPHEVYLVIDEATWKTYTDPHTVTDYGRMSSHFKATFIDDGQTLDVTLTGSPEEQVVSDPQKPFPLPGDHQKGIDKDIEVDGALVNNLVGMADATFIIHNGDTAKGRVNIVLNNMKYERTTEPDTEDGIYQGDRFEEKGVYGLDTEYWGELSGDAGVDLRKTGWGRLTIGSELGTGFIKLADGTLTIDQGSMTLQGDDNTLATLAFAYKTAEDAAMGEERTFWLKNGKTTIGSITEANAAAAGRIGADIAMEGALLTLIGESELADSTITGVTTTRMENRLSEVQLMKDAVLALTGTDKAQLSNVGLILEADGTLDVGSNASNSVRGITGAGALAGEGATLTVTDNLVDANDRAYAFSGILSGTGNTMLVQKDAKLLLRNAIGGDGWDVTNRGTLILDVSGSPASEDHLTHLGDLTLGSGSTTTLIVNTDLKSRELPTISVNHIDAQGGEFILQTTGKGSLVNTSDSNLIGPRYGVAFVRAEDQERDALNMHGEDANLSFRMQGGATWAVKIVDAYIEGGVLWLQMEKRNENTPLEGVTPDKNTQSGNDMTADAMNPSKNPHFDDINDPDSELGKVIDSLVSDSDAGNHNQMNDTLAALAGASTSVYGMVMAEDIHRQLRTTRNRAVMAASERCWSGVSCPTILHAYIMGEGSYNKMNSDRYAPGYTLSNWGGTMGLDVDLNRREDGGINVGLSLTAMYGDLRVNHPDRLRADMDTQYLTGYLRVDQGKWQHTLVLSGGLTELHGISRTVNYAPGSSYTTHGKTDGYSLGALYELGYNIVTNEEGTSCLQLVANAELRHVSLNAYTETGSDAALHVGNVDQDMLTLGVGGRFRMVVGYNSWNRSSTFEARALVKADVGDRSGTVANSLINGSLTRQEVESAKLGAMGVEIGAGLTIPSRRCGSFFIDAALELRQGAMHADANVGYRMTF